MDWKDYNWKVFDDQHIWTTTKWHKKNAIKE